MPWLKFQFPFQRSVNPLQTNDIFHKTSYNTIKSGWPFVSIKGSEDIVSQKIVFPLANSADPDKMPHYVAFHLGLHCLPKYPCRGFWSTKG